MGSWSQSAFSYGTRSEHAVNAGNPILTSTASDARITFSLLPELGMLSHCADRPSYKGSTASFVWVSSDDRSSNACHAFEPPCAMQRSNSDLHTGFLILPTSQKLRSSESCVKPLVHQVRKLASWADMVQAVLVHHVKEKGSQCSRGVPTLQSRNQGVLFCSIGLAGGKIRGVEKLSVSQAEATLALRKYSIEKESSSTDSHTLCDVDASKRLNFSASEDGTKGAIENRFFMTMKHLSAGAISAIVSRSFVAPLERLKLEYMVRGAQQNVLHIIQLIVSKEGVKGFWRGNTVNLLRTAPFKSVNFFCYDVYRKRLLEITGKEDTSNFERLVAGAAAGISATLLCFPMDTIRTRLVAPGGETLGGVLGCFQHMVQTEGFFSLYKGLLPAVISMAPAGAVFYGVYDILKTSYLQSPEGQEDLRRRIEVERQRRGFSTKVQGEIGGTEALKEEAGNLGQLEVGPMRTLLFGAIAGICAETATYPFEVVRRQLQMQNAASKMGALATCQWLVQRGGVGALYSGLLPSSLQVLPSAAISYFVYECMKVIFKVP
ncbi:hypothetical protein L7F22_011425 [Adiantum nelumboides]|nr:hypothetical protein [Adiantum nelumboides]